jgi:hypothetical protein
LESWIASLQFADVKTSDAVESGDSKAKPSRHDTSECRLRGAFIIASFNKLSLLRTKTDKKDALTIARYLFLNRDVLSTLLSSQAMTDLRDLARERESLLKMIASMKNDMRRILQTTFPELEQLVDILSSTMLCFLKVFPSTL